jgi:hypothetical protein
MSAVHPYAVDVEDIEIKTYSGKTLKLNDIVLEFSIFEATDQSFMTAEFMLIDSLALTTILPIVGSETITVKFKVPVSGMQEFPFEKEFRVLSIQKLDISKKVREASYILRCHDKEYFHDITSKVQKSYSDKPVTEMVKDIVKNYLKISDEDIEKKLKLSETEGMPTLVVPNMKPSEAIISLLCRYARSKKYQDISKYVFYSSQDGYYFTSYEDLVDIENKPMGYFVDRYTLKEKNLSPEAMTSINQQERSRLTRNFNSSTPEPPSESARLPRSKKPEDFLLIDDFVIVNKIDLEQALISGMIDSNTTYINPTVRSFQQKKFNYVNDFKLFRHLFMQTNQGEGYPVVETKTNELKSLQGDSKHFLMLTNEGNQHVNESIIDKRYLQIGYQNASINMLNSVIIDLYIPGDNTRKTGDLIELVIPQYGATDDVLGEVDQYISGMYLVTGVRHIYNVKDGYRCVLRCMKNCFEKPVGEFDQSGGTNEDEINDDRIDLNLPTLPVQGENQ